MKRLQTASSKCIFWILLILVPVGLAAQGEGSDVHVNVNDNGGLWYTNPVVWLVAATAFIFLLIVVLRGKKAPRN